MSKEITQENKVCLYIFTHNKTGLKYFGKTTRYFTEETLLRYKGSGIYWKQHLKKHGSDIAVEIYGIYNLDKVKEIALKFSEENNIVTALNASGKKVWANLVLENGIDGGDNNSGKKFPNRKCVSEEGKNNISKSKKGKIIVANRKPIKLLNTRNNNKYIFNSVKEFKEFCHKNKISFSKLYNNKNIICNWVKKGFENTIGFVLYTETSKIIQGEFCKNNTKAVKKSQQSNTKKYILYYKDKEIMKISGNLRKNIPPQLSYSILQKYINTYIISVYRKQDKNNIGYMLSLSQV